MISKVRSTRLGARPSDGSSNSTSLGPRHQGARDRQHLLLAARERAGRLVAPLVQDGKARVQPREIGGDGGASLRR